MRGELEQRGFHCITKNWKEISKIPDRWGNELYEAMNILGQPSSNRALQWPILQDYGFDGWKATKGELDSTFMKIVSNSLDIQHKQADSMKGIIAHFGPLISKLPYKGMWSEFIDRMKK